MSKASKNIILAVGGDDYAAEETVKAAIARLVPEEYRASAVEIVSGDASNADGQLASIGACLDSMRTPPFLDPVKFTWWKNVTFLPGGAQKRKLAGSVVEALDRFADILSQEPVPENQALAITAPSMLSTSVFAKKIKALAEVHDCSVPNRSYQRTAAALARLPALAKAENITFEPGADREFVAKAGPDTRTLRSELAKLRTYLGDESRAVTAKDVEEITSPGGDDIEIWALTNALATRNHARIIETLRCFQGDAHWPMRITASVEKWFRSLIAMKLGQTPTDYSAKQNASAAAGFTLTELRLARRRMAMLREKLVSSQPSDEFVELELLRTVTRPARR